MKAFLKIKKNQVFSFELILILSCIVVLGILIQSCESDIPRSFEDDIVSSVELEEYIIAASDFKQSLAVFGKEIRRIDSSTKLEIVYDTKGRKIMRFPVAFTNSIEIEIEIENKIQNFNKKKQALLEKYPLFASFTLATNKKYFHQCIQSSLNVSGRLLELGIDLSRPLLKSGSGENWYAEDRNMLTSFLSSWVSNANYVELYIVAHVDGSYSTWVDAANTTTRSHITVFENPNTGAYEFTQGGNNSPIAWVGHTHQDSRKPSDFDRQAAAENPGLTFYIYYQGVFYDYNYGN